MVSFLTQNFLLILLHSPIIIGSPFLLALYFVFFSLFLIINHSAKHALVAKPAQLDLCHPRSVPQRMVLRALPITTALLARVEAHIVAETRARARIVINVVPPVIVCRATRIAFSSMASVLHVHQAKLVQQGPAPLLRVFEATAVTVLPMPNARLGCAEAKCAVDQIKVQVVINVIRWVTVQHAMRTFTSAAASARTALPAKIVQQGRHHPLPVSAVMEVLAVRMPTVEEMLALDLNVAG